MPRLTIFAALATLMAMDPLNEIAALKQLNAAGYDRPVGDAKQSRSVTLARHGMVATSHPAAAQVGLDVLKSGGNAADAAIAVNAMLGVVDPTSCGLGGDLFVIYWYAKTQKLWHQGIRRAACPVD